jgi:bacillithiol system protein YtxJ
MITQTRGARVTDLTELGHIFAQSHQAPIILFLDDPYCPISRRAAAEVAALSTPVFRVDVSGQHAISQAIEQYTGVPHASPQLLVVKDGQAVWSASHRRITADAILGVLGELGPAQ